MLEKQTTNLFMYVFSVIVFIRKLQKEYLSGHPEFDMLRFDSQDFGLNIT
jgi:hypothetical protein